MLTMFQEKITHPKGSEEAQQLNPTFEELLEQYSYQRPRRGQILEGEIEAIREDAIILDVGLKRDAIVSNREVKEMDAENFSSLAVGDVIPIQVTSTPIGDQDLIVSIENAQEYQSWQNASVLLDEEQLIELEIIGSNKGGVLAAFEKLEGFIPNSHIPSLRHIRKPSSGSPY